VGLKPRRWRLALNGLVAVYLVAAGVALWNVPPRTISAWLLVGAALAVSNVIFSLGERG
jgi:hypothetical protein